MLLRHLSPVALGAMLAIPAPVHAPLAKGFTYDFVQLRTGWFAFRSDRGVHIVQLAL